MVVKCVKTLIPIENKVSPFWKINFSETSEITLWPPLFYQDDFFENFSDWEDKARNEFSKLKRLFEISSNS